MKEDTLLRDKNLWRWGELGDDKQWFWGVVKKTFQQQLFTILKSTLQNDPVITQFTQLTDI